MVSCEPLCSAVAEPEVTVKPSGLPSALKVKVNSRTPVTTWRKTEWRRDLRIIITMAKQFSILGEFNCVRALRICEMYERMVLELDSHAEINVKVANGRLRSGQQRPGDREPRVQMRSNAGSQSTAGSP